MLSTQRAAYLGSKWRRLNISEGQHSYLPIGEIGVAATIEAMCLFTKAGACSVLYEEASLGKFGDNEVAFVVQVGRDAVSGQMIGLGKLNLDVFCGAANPDGPATVSDAAGIPEADVVALADSMAWPLECQVFLMAKEVQITYRRGCVCTTKDRVNADTRRGYEVNLVSTVPTSGGKGRTDLSIGSADLHIDGITRIAVAIEGC